MGIRSVTLFMLRAIATIDGDIKLLDDAYEKGQDMAATAATDGWTDELLVGCVVQG